MSQNKYTYWQHEGLSQETSAPYVGPYLEGTAWTRARPQGLNVLILKAQHVELDPPRQKKN